MNHRIGQDIIRRNFRLITKKSGSVIVMVQALQVSRENLLPVSIN